MVPATGYGDPPGQPARRPRLPHPTARTR